MTALRAVDPNEPQIPINIPVSNQFANWTEFCLKADLNIDFCPTCGKDVPGNFMLFRPHGLEHWRCLACLAKSHHNGALFMPRVTTTGEDDPGF